MNNCAEMEEVISEMVFGDIPFEQQEELHGHMAECQGCMDFYLSLFETLADTEGEELAKGLTSKQKAKIFATARKIDSKKKNEKSKEPTPFKWKLPLSIAAAVAVSGIIIIPQISRSKMDMSAISREKDWGSEYDAKYAEPTAAAADKSVSYEEIPEEAFETVSKNAPSSQKPGVTHGRRSMIRKEAPRIENSIDDEDVLAKLEGESAGKKSSKTRNTRAEFERKSDSEFGNPFDPNLTTVRVDDSKSMDKSLEDVENAPSTDDKHLVDAVSDVVISPSAVDTPIVGGRGRVSPDNSGKDDFADLGGTENFKDPATAADPKKPGKLKPMEQEGLDVIGGKELAQKEEVIEELNKENDDLKNRNGALAAEKRRMQKQLEELKELYTTDRSGKGGEGQGQKGQSSGDNGEYGKKIEIAHAEAEGKMREKSAVKSLDSKGDKSVELRDKERAKQLAGQKYSEENRLAETKKNQTDKYYEEMARVEQVRRQEISKLEEMQKTLEPNAPVFGNEVTKDHVIRRELAEQKAPNIRYLNEAEKIHLEDSKSKKMDEKPGGVVVPGDAIRDHNEKVGKSRLENGLKGQLSFTAEDKQKSEVEWKWINPITGKDGKDAGGFQYGLYFSNNVDGTEIGYIQPKTPDYSLSLDKVFKDDEKNKETTLSLSGNTKADPVDAGQVADHVIGDTETANLHKIEEAIKQQPELEADSLAMEAAAEFKAGDYAAAERRWISAIEKYKRSGSDTRTVNKIQQIQKKLIELKSHKEPESRRPMIAVDSIPQSTFSIDVDTASYQLFKSAMNSGRRVDPASIRAEEFINYFKYNYDAPKKEAFKVSAEVAGSPFHRGSKIMKIGVQGKRPGGDHRAASHFCFIVDTSGSMAAEGRLPLVKRVLPMIVKQMSPGDKVSLISCGLKPRLIVDHMDVGNKDAIYQHIDSLNAVGATNLEASIIDGYNYVLSKVKKGVYSRVVLLSDGVANVGEDDANKILTRLEAARKKGVGITVIGMGENEYNDNFLETLANKGDGNYMFIDGGKEAQKAFEENFAATFHTIAYNVKIQVEFDPKQVKRYRLLGYENRRLKNKDFRNDKVDAGEVGSGQSVTAIYELELAENRREGNLCEVRLRYRDAADNKMKEFATPVKGAKVISAFENISNPTKLAFLAGMFAEVLRDGGTHEGVTVNDILKHMRPLSSEYGDSDVAELLRLMEKSK